MSKQTATHRSVHFHVKVSFLQLETAAVVLNLCVWNCNCAENVKKSNCANACCPWKDGDGTSCRFSGMWLFMPTSEVQRSVFSWFWSLSWEFDEAFKQLTCAILDVHRRFLALSFPDPSISVCLTNCFVIFCTVWVQIHSDTKILKNKHPCDEI